MELVIPTLSALLSFQIALERIKAMTTYGPDRIGHYDYSEGYVLMQATDSSQSVKLVSLWRMSKDNGTMTHVADFWSWNDGKQARHWHVERDRIAERQELSAPWAGPKV